MSRISRRHLLRGGGALAATKLLTPASAGFILGKAGGGGGYHALAVHFDGSTSLLCNSLSCTDSRYVLYVVWTKLPLPLSSNRGSTLLCSDPDTEVNNLFNISVNNSGNSLIVFETGAIPFSSGNTNYVAVQNPWNEGWLNLIYVIDSLHAAGVKPKAVYINDVLVPDTNTDTSGPYVAQFNGLKTTIGTDNFDLVLGDIADMQLYLLSNDPFVAGALPEATRRLFIGANGKPVNPATAMATLGTPVLIFSGDAITFPTNQGTGGAFSLTGTLTNATTSPSD